MKKIAAGLAVAIAGFAGGSLGSAAPALAQSATTGEVIVYGDDPCPRSTDDEVVVCVRRPETERYRIPENMRTSGTPQERTAWSVKSRALMNVGNTGINSCSAVGPGGHTGCLVQSIREAREQTRQQAEDNRPPE